MNRQQRRAAKKSDAKLQATLLQELKRLAALCTPEQMVVAIGRNGNSVSEEVAQLIGLSTPPRGTVATTGRVPRLAFAERMREAAEFETETGEAAYFGMLADRATQDIADDHRLVLLINDEVTMFMAYPAAAASAVGGAR